MSLDADELNSIVEMVMKRIRALETAETGGGIDGISEQTGTLDAGAVIVPTGTGLRFSSLYFLGEATNDEPNTMLVSLSQAFSNIFNSFGDYLVFVPTVYIFKVQNGVLTFLLTPTSLPSSGSVLGCCWSYGSVFLVVVNDTAPFINVYLRSVDEFDEIPSPFNVLPSAQCNRVEFSPNSTILAIASVASPRAIFYTRSGIAFTLFPASYTLPTGSCLGVSWHPTGIYCGFAHATSPYTTIYSVTASPTITKIADPSTLPAGQGYCCGWSAAGDLYAVGHLNSPFVTIYTTSAVPFTKVADPATIPTSAVQDLAFSPDGRWLAMAFNDAPHLIIYEITSGPTFTLVTDITDPPTGSCNLVSWSKDSKTLAVSRTAELLQYMVSGGSFTRLGAVSGVPAAANDMAWSR